MKNTDGKISSNLSAFDYLQSIEQAERLNLKEANSPQSDNLGWVGLMFLSGHSVLMTPLKEVVGIIPVSTFAKVPNVKPWLLGMSSYRGKIFPVTDFAGMLTSELTVITKDSRILIIATGDEYSGLLVARVLGLQRVFEHHSVEGLPFGLMAEYEPFVVGAIMNERFQLPIISCKSIVQHPQFKKVRLKETEG